MFTLDADPESKPEVVARIRDIEAEIMAALAQKIECETLLNECYIDQMASSFTALMVWLHAR